MKKSAFLVSTIVLIFIILFVSCDKIDDAKRNVIYAEDVKPFSDSDNVDNIATVKAFLYGSKEGIKEIASSKFDNNGFTLTLPNDIDEKYLINFPNIPDGLTISQPDAKQGNILILAFDNEGKQIGSFSYFTYQVNNNKEVNYFSSSSYAYFNKNVTIKGNYSFGDIDIKYNCSFKKGWNIGYTTIDNTKEGSRVTWLFTSKKPAKDKFIWYFEEGNILLLFDRNKYDSLSENFDHFAPIPTFLRLCN